MDPLSLHGPIIIMLILVVDSPIIAYPALNLSLGWQARVAFSRLKTILIDSNGVVFPCCVCDRATKPSPLIGTS